MTQKYKKNNSPAIQNSIFPVSPMFRNPIYRVSPMFHNPIYPISPMFFGLGMGQHVWRFKKIWATCKRGRPYGLCGKHKLFSGIGISCGV